MKQYRFPFLLVALHISPLLASEAGKTFPFALLPTEIQQIIVNYCDCDTRDQFKILKNNKRIISSSDQASIFNNKELIINDKGSLKIKKYTKNKIKLYLASLFKLNSHTLAKSSLDTTPKHMIQEKFFGLSPSHKFAAFKKNHHEIEIFNLTTKTKKASYRLDDYYNNDGTILYKKNNPDLIARGYRILNKTTYFNPVRSIAVSDNGEKLAFANDHQVFVVDNVENQEPYRKIYEEPLKYFGPFKESNEPDAFYPLLSPKEIEFSPDASKLLISHRNYDAFPPQTDISNPPSLFPFFRKLFENLFEKYRDCLPQEMLNNIETLNKEQDDESYSNQAIDLLSVFKNAENNLKHFTFVDIRPEKVIQKENKMSALTRYFKKKGVCKNLNA